ncbi:hypothetical protein DIPPA_18832 [Diplonema papillatum]|nr:hypothetical protein DIPPA_18832 [Diplonema papillatum]
MKFPSWVFDFQFLKQLTAGKLSTKILIVDSGEREAAYAIANFAAVSSAKKMCCGTSLHGPHIAMEPPARPIPACWRRTTLHEGVRGFESKTTHRLPDRRRLHSRKERKNVVAHADQRLPAQGTVQTWCARVPIHASTGLTLQSGVPHTVHAK